MVNSNPQEFTCPGPIEAVIGFGAGDLTVTGHDAALAIVEVTPHDNSEASRSAAAETLVAFGNGQLHIEAPEHSGGWLRRGGRIHVRVHLPAGSAVSVRTGSADARLDGRLNAVDIQTGSGDVFVEQVSGDLNMTTGSGDLRARRIDGSLLVKSGSGDIDCEVVGGQVNISTSSGDVQLHSVAAATQVRTASGDVALGTVHGDQVGVVTASGDVSVGVPAGTGVWLDLTTASGSTHSDLAMTGEAPPNGAQLNLSVRTASGDINVHRSPLAPIMTLQS